MESNTNDNQNDKTDHKRESVSKEDADPSALSEKSKRIKRCDLHVEAMMNPRWTFTAECTSMQHLKNEIEKFVVKIGQQTFTYNEGTIDIAADGTPSIIQQSCLLLTIHFDNSCANTNTHTNTNPTKSIATWSISNIHIYVYTPTDSPSEPEEIEEHNEEPITVCQTLQLPHTSLHTAWDNLIMPAHIKSNLLSYARSALMFSQKNVSPHIINWNRVLLLYGPPGTGKTTLCRALAHKLTIRSVDAFPSGGYLLEIKSHSLFSKWFSESGKLISRLFGRIREMVEDEPDALFCVLVDEVESLASRRVGSGGVEPSDAVRAVNSLLTSLDSIRQFRNVLILSTSNITESVDSAFVDRVDWMVKIGLPCVEARYEILKGCLIELGRVGVLQNDIGSGSGGDGDGDGDGDVGVKIDFFTYDQIVKQKQQAKEDTSTDTNTIARNGESSELLLECATLAEGLSGRALRKLPFQSHAFHVRSVEGVSLIDFLHALKAGVEMKVKGDI